MLCIEGDYPAKGNVSVANKMFGARSKGRPYK